MWVDELLFVLMVSALIAMAVLVLLVNMKTRNGREATPKGTVPEPPAPKPQTAAAQGRVNLTRIPEPEVEEEPIEPLSDPLPVVLPELPQTPQPDHVFEPTPRPAEPPSEPDQPLFFVEAPQESPPVKAPEPSAPPVPEPVVLVPSLKELAPPADEPAPVVLRRETESQFFDLRYDNKPQVVIHSEPSILDGSPSIEYEEEEEEEKEPPPGVVTCPHCKSKVPQTLYCIYCGNTLAAKPAAK